MFHNLEEVLNAFPLNLIAFGFDYLWDMSSLKTIESKISQLSPSLIEELDAYLDYLMNKRTSGSSKKLKQKWAGALNDVEISALELQKNRGI